MTMTGMPASLAFFTAGTSAVTSEGARTIALTPRSIALSTMLISSATLLSDWGPRNVTDSFGVFALSSFWASKHPVWTFCQKLELPVFTITAISCADTNPAMKARATRMRRSFFIPTSLKHLRGPYGPRIFFFPSGRASSVAQLIERHGSYHHEADDDLLHEIVGTLHRETDGEDADDEGTDHGPSHRTHAPHEARAADHGGGDCVQLVADRAVRLGGDHP